MCVWPCMCVYGECACGSVGEVAEWMNGSREKGGVTARRERGRRGEGEESTC